MSHRFHSVVRVLDNVRGVFPAFVFAILTVFANGCTDGGSTGSVSQPAAQAPNAVPPPAIQTGPAFDPVAVPEAPVAVAAESVPAASVPAADQGAPAESDAPTDPGKPRRIIGKTTQDVRAAKTEEAKGAKKVQPKITGQDPITVTGNAYSVIVGRAEQLQIKHSIDLFYNLHERYPKDTKEFMKEIIHANRIRLAQLPFYQEYGYDPVKHELVILEYPDKKAQLPGGGN
jgi:hypothetical protein